MKTIQTFSPFLGVAASHGGISRKMTRQRYHLQYDEWTYESFPTPPRCETVKLHTLSQSLKPTTLRVSKKICEVHHVHPYKHRSEEQEDIALSTLFLLKGTWTNLFCCCTDTKISAGWCTCENGKWNLPLKSIFSYSGCALCAPHSYLFQRGGHLAKNRADLSNFLVWYLREQ